LENAKKTEAPTRKQHKQDCKHPRNKIRLDRNTRPPKKQLKNPHMRRNADPRTQKQEAVHEKGGMLGGARFKRTGAARQNEGEPF
jgi:hypothetical protein